MAEALRDLALHVGRGSNPAFTTRYAVAFDEAGERIRTYDLASPGEHPDLPYDPFAYDPAAESE